MRIGSVATQFSTNDEFMWFQFQTLNKSAMHGNAKLRVVNPEIAQLATGDDIEQHRREVHAHRERVEGARAARGRAREARVVRGRAGAARGLVDAHVGPDAEAPVREGDLRRSFLRGAATSSTLRPGDGRRLPRPWRSSRRRPRRPCGSACSPGGSARPRPRRRRGAVDDEDGRGVQMTKVTAGAARRRENRCKRPSSLCLCGRFCGSYLAARPQPAQSRDDAPLAPRRSQPPPAAPERRGRPDRRRGHPRDAPAAAPPLREPKHTKQPPRPRRPWTWLSSSPWRRRPPSRSRAGCGAP